ncbi:MAG: hypothetical protein Q7R41_00700, partial [Phycisphaerales bacterium]|nr:hypothetical protein [Phycisphaerales bacterium]
MVTQLLGPISDSPVNRICIGGSNGGATCTTSATCIDGGICSPLHKLGDDYKLTNDPGFIALDFLRFVGGSIVSDRINFEFYDANGNFVEDFFFSSSEGFGVYPVVFDPPIVIPSEGFVVASTASHFAPEAMHAWAVTDAVDVGFNVNTKLWVNDGPVTVASNLGVLAFELVGVNTTGPSGACCTGAAGACENAALPWVCTGAGDVYLGDDVLCAACDTGASANQYCRRCSNDANQSCNKDSECGGINTCIPTDSACDQSQGAAVCVAEPACGVGACCNPTTGECTVGAEANCTGGGGDFQGNGTDCDADNGHDAAQQHCCPQPLSTYTGADDCLDAVVHMIEVPPPGDPPRVVTITGDNSGATNSDYCPPEGDCGSNLGWWEAFETDNCSMIRIDYCCTDPVKQPAYVNIDDQGRCAPQNANQQPNPFKYPEPGY